MTPNTKATTMQRGEDIVDAATFAALGDDRFVSLTTFRRFGVPVSTPVWIGRDGDALIVTTPAGSGKVKRLRTNGRVELRPCTRRGNMNDGVAPIAGVAEIVTDVDEQARLTHSIRNKYKLEYRIVMTIERLIKSGPRDRVILRITRVIQQAEAARKLI